MDLLSYGCLLAVFWENQRFHALLNWACSRSLHWIGIAFLGVAAPLLTRRFQGGYLLTVGWALQGLGLSLLLAYSVRFHESRLGRFLNLRWMKRIGVLSYSLYLWQQPFLTTENGSFSGVFPLNVLCVFGAAWISYNWIEKPFLKLKSRFSHPEPSIASHSLK